MGKVKKYQEIKKKLYDVKPLEGSTSVGKFNKTGSNFC